MTEIEAIKELNTYVSDEHKMTLSRECIDLARNALEKQISLKRILERLEETYDATHENYMKDRDLITLGRKYGFEHAIEIVKEEGGIEWHQMNRFLYVL